MKNLNTFEEFLNEAYTRRFGNFQVAIGKEKIKLQWLDQIGEIPDGVKKVILHFGKTPLGEIGIIFEKDVKNFDEVRGIVSKCGVLGLFGLDLKLGRFCVLNSNS
jgi:hypothetical protein